MTLNANREASFDNFHFLGVLVCDTTGLGPTIVVNRSRIDFRRWRFLETNVIQSSYPFCRVVGLKETVGYDRTYAKSFLARSISRTKVSCVHSDDPCMTHKDTSQRITDSRGVWLQSDEDIRKEETIPSETLEPW